MLADRLQNHDGGPKARKLAQKMQAAIPRFEATEEKRKRREYRLMRKEQFKRPEPGFSMYEGRTRGKRMKYTYSDDEDFYSDSTNRKSTRNTGTHTPAEPAGPVTTASGRQIKAPSRMTVDASNNIVTTSPTRETEDVQAKESLVGPGGRPRRSAAVNHGTNGWAASKKRGNDDEMDEEDDSEPDLGDDEEDDHVPDVDSEDDEEDEDFDEDEAMADDDLDDPSKGDSMVVKLKYSPKANGATLDLDAFRYDGGDKKGNKLDPKAKSESKDSPRAERSEESIDVAIAKRQATPTPDTQKPSADNTEKSNPHPPTPALNSLQSTSLAIRESPEKTQQQSLRHSVDIVAK